MNSFLMRLKLPYRKLSNQLMMVWYLRKSKNSVRYNEQKQVLLFLFKHPSTFFRDTYVHGTDYDKYLNLLNKRGSNNQLYKLYRS